MKKLLNISSETYGRVAVVLVTVLFSITAGCGRSKPSHFYTLREVLPEATAVADAKNGAIGEEIVLGVGPVSVPGYMDRTKIVKRINTAEVGLSEYYRWAEPTLDKIEYILQENLAKLCVLAEVRKYTFRTSSSLTHYVRVDITEFIAETDDNVVLNARYTIFPIDEKEKPVRKTVSLKKGVKSGDYNDIVFAMSSLLGELSVDIGESVKLLK